MPWKQPAPHVSGLTEQRLMSPHAVCPVCVVVVVTQGPRPVEAPFVVVVVVLTALLIHHLRTACNPRNKVHSFEITGQSFFVYSQSCNRQHNRILFPHSPRHLLPVEQSSPLPSSVSLWPLSASFLSLWVCPFWTFHINGILQYVTFCGWLLSFSVFSEFFVL